MAHIRPVDKERPNGPFRIDVKHTTDDGEQLRWTFYRDTLAEAQLVAGLAAKDLREGDDPEDRYRVVKRKAGMTVGEWIGTWRVDRGLTPGAQVNERSHLDNHILPVFGDVPFDDPTRLSRLRVQRWVTRMEDDGYAPRTVRTVYGCFKTLVLDAIDEPTVPISASPFVRIRLPKVEPTGRRALEPAEVGAILGHLRAHPELGWTLAFTGARVGELLARDVGDWSPMAGLSIPPGTRRRRRADDAESPKGPKGARRGAKTPSGIRVIGLCGSHREMLRAYVGERTSGPLFLGRDPHQTVARQRVKYDAFFRRFEAAAEAAGLVGVTPHWFRHTVKTWLREDGCDPVAVNEHLGHKTPGMDGVYVHVTPGMRAPVLASLEARWRLARGTAAEGGGVGLRGGGG